MAETPNLGLYVADINQASDAGMSVFKLLELLLGSGYVDKSNMEKIDEAISVIKDKLADYKSENVYITDHQKEGIENKQSEFNWTKNNQIEYFAKLLGGYEKGILTVENTTITSDKSDILFTVTQGFSKLNNTTTSGISEIQLAKSLLCERIMLDIKNDNESIVYLTVYITVNGVQTTIPMTVPAKASVQKSFYNSIVRDLDDNSTIKFQAQTDGLPLIINAGSKAQYDYIDIDKISNLGDNFSDIIDNISDRTTSLETNLYNPNLLFNSNFKVSNLINQRGQTSYTTNGYTFDMWRLGKSLDGQLDLTDTKMKFKFNSRVSNGYFNLFQYIENYKELQGKTVTLSVKVKNLTGEGYMRSNIQTDNKPNYNAWYVYKGDVNTLTRTVKLPENITDSLFVSVYVNDSMNDWEIEYIKLEIGENATPFVDDDPATKVAKCQRYLQVYEGASILSTGVITSIDNINNTFRCVFQLPLSQLLRTIPRIEYTSGIRITVWGKGDYTEMNEIVLLLPNKNNNFLTLHTKCKNAGMSVSDNMPVTLQANTTAKILISAEL